MILGHGDDIHNYENIKVNFSSNINPSGINYDLLKHLQKKISTVTTYPHPLAIDLVNMLSETKDIPQESLLICNGAVEGLYLAASLKQACRSLVYIPSFAEYEDACKAYEHQIEYRLNTTFNEDESFDSFDMVWIANPNNPDGRLFDSETIKKLSSNNPDTLFVVDEAYIDFIKDSQSLLQDASLLKNLIVIHSLTKKYIIPGLRIGYLSSHPDIITRLKNRLMPWRINSMAIEAALFCISNKATTTEHLDEWLTESKRVQTAMHQLKSFKTCFSPTIFFLMEGQEKASVMKHKLATQHGLLIRDASNFRGLTDKHFRIAIRKPEENNLLIETLQAWS